MRKTACFQWLGVWLMVSFVSLNSRAQVNDTAYFYKRLGELVQYKNRLSDSIFIIADDIRHEFSSSTQLREFADLRVNFILANYWYRKREFATSLKMYEEVRKASLAAGDTFMVININESRGNVYQFLGNHQKSVNMFKIGLKHWQSIGKEDMAARSARNIAESYLAMKDYDLAIQYADTALTIYKSQLDSNWIPETYFHKIYAYLKLVEGNSSLKKLDQIKADLDTALKYVSPKSEGDGIHLKLLEGQWHQTKKDFVQARDDCQFAYNQLSQYSFSTKSLIDETCMCLALAYDSLGVPDSAVKYLGIYKNFRDSLSFYDGDRLAHKFDLELGFRNKQAQDKLKNEARLKHEEARRAAFLKQQQTYWIIGALCLLFLAIVMIIIYRRSKRTRLLFQDLAEHNKDLMDSIHYAERIQRSMLPVEKEMAQEFHDHFVLFKPKDVVAGDFYWMTHQDKYTFIAAADCTGHGVPGALVSLICHEALQQATQDLKISKTNEVLDKVRTLVKERLSVSGEEIKDGMDIALCRINHESMELQFSGAYNPMWLIRNGVLQVYKASRQPIGIHHNEQPFHSETIQLEKGDKIYIFSDGFADQFGGDEGKKLRTKNFKKLILEQSQYNMNGQLKQLQDFFDHWKGNYEQLDDVCLIGIEI